MEKSWYGLALDYQLFSNGFPLMVMHPTFLQDFTSCFDTNYKGLGLLHVDFMRKVSGILRLIRRAVCLRT